MDKPLSRLTGQLCHDAGLDRVSELRVPDSALSKQDGSEASLPPPKPPLSMMWSKSSHPPAGILKRLSHMPQTCGVGSTEQDRVVESARLRGKHSWV